MCKVHCLTPSLSKDKKSIICMEQLENHN
jgi:hypothetical protein